MSKNDENKAIGALKREDTDTMNLGLKQPGRSDKRSDRIIVDVSQQIDKRGNAQ